MIRRLRVAWVMRRAISAVALVLLALGASVLTPTFAAASSPGASGQLSATSNSSAGPLLVLGGVVIFFAVMAFAFLATSRRKKRPSECAEQRAALESAERSLQYWEKALTHLQCADPSAAGAPSTDGGDGEALRGALEGRAAAASMRDQCQVDLVNCLGHASDVARVNPWSPHQ
jgi:Tfp pilus assembly protein PilX